MTQAPTSTAERGASAARPVILHLAVEYNDPHKPKTTNAVERLVEGLPEFDHVVISMTRVADPRATYMRDCGTIGPARVFAHAFLGLPFGMGLKASMKRAARQVRALLEREGIRPDLLHAHKFTFEGIEASFLAQMLGVPYFVSSRGEVETKIFRLKPTYRPFLRRVAREAAGIMHVSAWFRDEYHSHVPAREDERLLPNFVKNVAPRIEPSAPGGRFVSILNLDTWKRKRLGVLLKGFARALEREPGLRLDVIGGGSDASRAIAERLARDAGVTHAVDFVGSLPNDELIARLPHYRALLLPSANETFGMVYVEALFAGVPILYTRETGIDGYLDGLDVGIGVPVDDADAVADAVMRLDGEAEGFRERLAAAGPELFQRFDRERLLAVYRSDVARALGRAELAHPASGASTPARPDPGEAPAARERERTAP